MDMNQNKDRVFHSLDPEVAVLADQGKGQKNKTFFFFVIVLLLILAAVFVYYSYFSSRLSTLTSVSVQSDEKVLTEEELQMRRLDEMRDSLGVGGADLADEATQMNALENQRTTFADGFSAKSIGDEQMRDLEILKANQ